MGLAERYPVRYTVENWKHWKGDWELIEGVPYAMASPRPVNQYILVKISQMLANILDNTRDCNKCFAFAELDWYISYDTVIRPDLMVLCGEIPDKVESPPQMVVEIVSPSNRQMDEGLKFELCEREGVKYFVLLYPDERQVKVFELVGSRYEEKRDSVFTFGRCELNIDFSGAFDRLR
ncbi:Uma2 family endonuclease [Hydrogenobacter sp. T-2]|uniref:Uma2 family endonuclease n=1 Tax=Pampinifervens diazotrophicum TaxID=1632018 RepID=UPI002B2593CF|nr:Uma2 family endonuclease [Hydrogenobacter sp. T-2]WPM31558.1 Uma2 family endonuclease [Hydrogenobacter sp. T-2]